jgi:preprotein translocase subunit SecE
MNKVVTFFKEVREEVSQITWPNRDEVTRFTFVVLVAIAIMALFLFVVDSALMQIVKLIMR